MPLPTDTGKAAYWDLKEKGRKSKLAAKIYLWIWDHPGCTQREAMKYFNKEADGTIGTRFSELVLEGKLIEVGKTEYNGRKQKCYAGAHKDNWAHYRLLAMAEKAKKFRKHANSLLSQAHALEIEIHKQSKGQLNLLL